MTPRSRLDRALVMTLAALLGGAPTVTAQSQVDLRAGAVATAQPPVRSSEADPAPRGAFLKRLPAWTAPIASAILPGLGQARLGNDRFVAYLSAEAFLLLRYSKDEGESRRNANGYRALARDIARRGFVDNPPDTIFQYYEKLEKYLESGAFSTAANGPTVPEDRADTYNGSLWVLSRQQYGVPNDRGEVGSARYLAAVAYYETRAVRRAYGWSWRNAQLEQDLFRRAIQRSNDASRRATLDVSAIIANHILSTVDAFAVLRVRQLPSGRMRLSAAITLP